MIRTIVLALVLLAGTGIDLTAQDRPGRGKPGPISTLLEHRAELGLTASQVADLQRIDDEMDQRNAPLVAQMIQIRKRIRSLGPKRDMDGETRRTYESYVAEARPIMRQIHRNNRAAMEEVGQVLTDSQKATISRFLKERDSEREQSGRSSGSPNRKD